MTEIKRRWFVVCTDPRTEGRVAWTLKALAFEVFLPMESFTKVVRNKKLKVRRPIFPRYVFVEFDPQDGEHHAAINGVRGAQGILADNNGTAIVVPTSEIDLVKRLEANGEYDLDKLPVPDETFRVATGHLAGAVGKVKWATDNGRVKLMLKMLGGLVAAEFQIEHLERVELST